MNDALLRELVPAVIGVLVRRGADFASAEDAVQEAVVRALAAWPDAPPRDPKGWLVTAAWHRFVDDARSQSARRVREDVVHAEPAPGPVPVADDTLALYFLCAHPALSTPSAVALTLRAVGGLTTAQIASAYLVPEPTMAQAGGRRAARPHAAAPRPARLADRARRSPRPARPAGPHALGHPADRRGRGHPAGRAGTRPARRVPGAGRDRLDPGLPRFAAVAAHLRERAGELERAAQLYADAARAAASAAERDHLIREAARVRQVLRPSVRRRPGLRAPSHDRRRGIGRMGRADMGTGPACHR